MAQIDVQFSGDESDVAAAYERIIAEQQKTIDGLKRMGEESKKTERAAKELERAAKRVHDETRTPQEKHNQRLKELNELLAKGKINQEEYNRAVAKSADELTRAKESGQQAFGAGAVAQIGGMIAGYASLTKVIDLTTTALNKQREAADAAAAASRKARPSAGMLAQVAKSPEEYEDLLAKAEDFYKSGAAPSMEAAYSAVFSMASTGTLEQFEFLKNVTRSGLVSDIAPAIESVNALKAAFGKKETGDLRGMFSKALATGAAGTGTMEQLLQAAAEAGVAGKSLQMRDEEVLASIELFSQTKGAPGAGTLARGLLSKLNEAAVFAENQEDPQAKYDEAIADATAKRRAGLLTDEGLDRARRAARLELETAQAEGPAISPEDTKLLRSGTLLEKLDVVERAGGMDSPTFKPFFGTQEARDAYTMLTTRRADYQQYLKEIDQAPAQDVVGQQMRLPLMDPEIAAAAAADRAEAVEARTRTKLGTTANLADAVEASIVAKRREESPGMLGEWDIGLGSAATATARWMFGDEAYLERMAGRGHNRQAPAGGNQIPDPELRRLVDAQLDAARANKEAAQEIRSAIKDASGELKNAATQLQRPKNPAMSDPRIDR